MKDILIKALVLGGGLALALTPAAKARAMDYRAVFTAPPQKIPSDNSVDAPLLGNGDTLAALGGTADKLRFYINKNDLWIMRAAKGSQPMPLARLELDFPGLQGASYRVEQNLQQAITTGRFTQAGVTLSLETGMAATENLLWIKLSAEGGAVQGRAGLYLPGQDAAATGDVPVVERRFEQDVLVPSGAACAMRVVGGGREFTVTPGKPVLIVASVCSRFDQPEFRQAAVRRANELGPEALDRVRSAHVAWWRQFWAKSFVEIPDKVLEQRYYLSHYVMASASRVYDFPPGLFGWITTDKPSWYGDYHLNYNHVAPFYGLYAANHIGQADPCHGPLLASADQARALCRAKLGIEGLFQYVGIGPKGSVAFDVALMQKSNSSYSCVPLAFRWYATYDLDYARLAYPFVRDTTTFWENWLKWEANRYVIYKDAVHEGSGDNVNPIVSLAFVRMVMNLALDMSGELGVDAARHEKWIHIRDHISAYPACRLGDLKDWWPAHLPRTDENRNLPIFRYTEQGTEWWNDNTLGIQHIYPAGGIGLDSSPELRERARNQIRVMNRWVDFNGMNSFYAAAARVGYDPTVILKEMRSMIDSIGAPNGMIPSNPHGMEHQSIVPNAIQEMLLQSHEGVIRFFPCWPKEQNARFGTLRARGAFLVSAELKSGEVQYVKIHSEKGRPCTLVNPWPGKAFDVYRDGKKVETVKGERVVLKTEAGMTVILGPEGVGVDSLHGCIGIMGDSQRKMSPAASAGTTYYVDELVGNDSADGGAAAPWRSLERVNRQVFAPGDAVLFKAGCRWQGQLRPQGSGSEGHPIRIDRYGEGPLPAIDMGAATGAAVQLSNQEYWEIRHLEITSGAPPAGDHRQGILMLGSGAGRVFHHIVVGDCHIHDMWGLLGGRPRGIDSYTSTAILVASPRGEQVATFDNVLIERNVIERVDRSAIIVWTPTKAASATRVVVRHNRMNNLGGDAILILGSIGSLVEYNVVNHAGLRCGDPSVVLPDGAKGYNACAASIWMHTCDRSIMQFNEVYDTNVQGTNQDGQAFDFDFDCRHCVLQYNYSRHNRGGWLLIMPSAEHNIARFNISENDQARLMCGGSSLEAGNHLYNNVFYVDYNTVEVFTNAIYTNNIFYATGQGRFKISKRKPGLLSHNVYFGPWLKLPEDAHAMLEDPRFVAPGTGGIGLDSLTGYRLRADSPCRTGGAPIADPGGRDFWGSPLAEGAKHVGP